MPNAALLALLIPSGFALLTCGLVRKKNAGHLVMLNLSAFVFALLAYMAVGFAFEFGGVMGASRFLIGRGAWGVIGGTGFFLSGASSNARAASLAMIDFLFVLAAASVLVGAICERMTFRTFVCCELFLGAVLYPLFGCWTWGGGWLSQLGASLGLGHGFVDVGGSAVVHEVGGFSAMALAMLLGPRLGKYGADGRPRPFLGHNIVFVVVGTMILLGGWMGLAAGSSAQGAGLSIALIALNTTVAAAAGAAAAILFWTFSYGTPDISMACNGLLAGLVAVSAGAPFLAPASAALLGIVAGLLACAGVLFNERVLKIDDPCGSISVHGYCGWLGAVALGLLANGQGGAGWNGIGPSSYLGTPGAGVSGLFYGDARQFAAQIAGATLCAIYAFGLTYIVFRTVGTAWPLRVDPEIEIEGLDLHEFGMLAYPEDESLTG